MSEVDTSSEACAVACMLVSNPLGEMRLPGWQKRVNDLIRALREERDDYKKTAWESYSDCVRLRAQVTAAERKIAVAVEGFEIISGKRQCLDNLMGNRDIAECALTELEKEGEDRFPHSEDREGRN